MWIWLYFAGGNYEVTKEYYTYDTNSFIGDVGGYLGLCLGLSLLSFFDLGVDSGLWIMAKLACIYVYCENIHLYTSG